MSDESARMHVKPAREGLVMIDPASGRQLPPEGALVVPSTYWRRRIADGDAVLVEAPASSPASARAKERKET